MTLTLLLDLDDTLLKTNQAVFVPVYFQALSTKLVPHLDSSLVARALVAGTNAMNQSEDSSRVLEDVFEDVFYPMLGLEKARSKPRSKGFTTRSFQPSNRSRRKTPTPRHSLNGQRNAGIGLWSPPTRSCRVKPPIIECAGRGSNRGDSTSSRSSKIFIFRNPSPPIMPKSLGDLAGRKVP